jgi:polyhydroxyalkanoate synthesis regulator phasin
MASLSHIVQPLDHTYAGSDDPLLLNNNSCVYIISGRRGAGKSTLALSLLNSKKAWRKRFDNIFLISATAKADKKFRKLVGELAEDGKYSDHLDEEVVNEIFQQCQQANQDASEGKKPLHLMLLDDVIMDLPKSRQSLLNRLVIQSRHHNLTLCLITQKYNLVPTVIRANADLISFFPSLNAKEVQTFQEDLNLSRPLFERIYREATGDDPQSFLHCNLLAYPPLFYKKFDRINVDVFNQQF